MPTKIFFCYAHEDEALLNMLKKHLWPLQRQGLIDTWHDHDISAGDEWEQEITQKINEANIILLLISPDFMFSDYCYGKEMKRALERHERKEARVIPVILRPIYWQGALGKLQALPKDAVPITNQTWHSIDDALFDVAESLRTIVEGLQTPLKAPLEQVKARNELSSHKAQEETRNNTIEVSRTSPTQLFTGNQQHLDILKQGVSAWNRWRNENRAMLPDLSSADLNHTDLRCQSQPYRSQRCQPQEFLPEVGLGSL